jgi:hypothetical protein
MVDKTVCAVHLVRASNGIDPLARFLHSYREHTAGIDHTLLVVLKGFAQDSVPPEYEKLLGDVVHERMHVADRGFDITSYFKAAAAVSADSLCFLNSFSRILADGWLDKLHQALMRPGVGVAGATGSWQGVYRDWRIVREIGDVIGRPAWKQALLNLPLVARINLARHALSFPNFPNPHVRTNAFMIRRDTMLALHPSVTRTKSQAYRFESGKDGMTRQILRMGKTACVVGRNGRAYEIAEWKDSETFWIAKQANLLISDNQTRRYDEADARGRRAYNWFAWADAGMDTPASRGAGN